jgi:hypothetical protein
MGLRAISVSFRPWGWTHDEFRESQENSKRMRHVRKQGKIQFPKEEAMSAGMKEVIEAMGAAHADADAKGLGKEPKRKGGVSTMKCPVCADGTLRYSVAGLNGHMWAGCTTKDCVRWME